MSEVREAVAADIPGLAALLRDYMAELFRSPWSGTEEALAAGALGAEARTLVAARDGALVGFAFWRRTWDVHHCLAGGELLDLYVVRAFRGGPTAPELLLATLAAIAASGGVFVKGQGVSAGADRLYDRLAVTFPGTEFAVGGRAFRELAALHGRPIREVLHALPPKSANHEP